MLLMYLLAYLFNLMTALFWLSFFLSFIVSCFQKKRFINDFTPYGNNFFCTNLITDTLQFYYSGNIPDMRWKWKSVTISLLSILRRFLLIT